MGKLRHFVRTNITWPSQKKNSQWQVPKASSWYPSNSYLSYFSSNKVAFEISTPLVLEEAEYARQAFLGSWWKLCAPLSNALLADILERLPAGRHKGRIRQEHKHHLSLVTYLLQHLKAYPEPTTTTLQTGITYWLRAVRNLGSPIITFPSTSNLCLS